MAHPKWPRTPSEPLDERTLHYCEQDVVRHTMQWREAAARKGLVSFEAPTDGGLYHPKRSGDWPRPLHSHEADLDDPGASDRRTAVAKTASSDSSTVVAEKDSRQESVKEEESGSPSDLPASATAGLERSGRACGEPSVTRSTWRRTPCCMYWMAFMRNIWPERQRLIQAMASSGDRIETLEDAVSAACGYVYTFPAYPRLRGFPGLTGEPLFRRTAPGGPMEQAALRGWVSDVFRLWGESLSQPAQARGSGSARLGTGSAAELYRNCLKGERRSIPGLGIYEPWVQFRK